MVNLTFGAFVTPPQIKVVNRPVATGPHLTAIPQNLSPRCLRHRYLACSRDQPNRARVVEWKFQNLESPVDVSSFAFAGHHLNWQ